jgi:chromosome segregation ATPase
LTRVSVNRYSDQPLRRAWLRGYRKGDVEVNLAQYRLLVQGLEQELDSARRRADELASEVRELRDRDASVRGKEIELVEALSNVRHERERLEAEAQTKARDLVLDAEARAAEVRSEALRRVEELQRQTDELMALRQRLVANVRRAVDEVDAVVRHVEIEVPTARPLESDLAPTTRPD